jgi:hypothetical protein
VELLRAHRTAVAGLVVAAFALGAVFAFVRPKTHPSVTASPPRDLPYRSATYSTADAIQAFAAVGVRLSPRSKSATITTLGNRGDTLEVDVFGDARRVTAAGFHDYLFVNGRYTRFPRACGTARLEAERWRGNVRVIVRCTPAARLRHVERALALLS